MRRSIRWRQYRFAASRSARESNGGCEIYRRHPSCRTARGHHPALAACACPDRRTGSRGGARDARRGRCDLAARRRPHRTLCRPADRGCRRKGSKDRGRGPRRYQDRQRAPAVGDRTGRGPKARCARRVRKIQPQEGRQRFRRHRLARALETERPWTVFGILAQGKEGARLDGDRARDAKCLARRGNFPHRNAAAFHATVARFDGDRLTVHVSTQAVFHVMELLAKRYKLGHDKIRVIADHVGGGFGSKGALGIETTAAIDLAREARAPVRIAYDRHEELSVTGYRPAAEVRVALLPSERGDLKALSLTAYADTGAAVNSTLAALGRLIYPAEAKELADYDVISNLPPGAPFRGPGGPPMAFALEQAIDEAALRMNVDPIALRKRWDPNPNRQRLYDWAAALEVWRNKRTPASQTGRYRRGVGVATGYWLYLWQPGSKVELAVEGGRIVASTATQDIGQGSRTVIANTVAHEFGLDLHDVEVRIGDSNLPEGPGAGGSRTTASVIPPTLLAVQKLKAAIERNAKRPPLPGSNAPWRELIAASPDLSVSAERPEDDKPTLPGIRSPLKEVGFIGTIFGWMMRRFSNIVIGAGVPSSVQVIEVEVDTWLGHVHVLNVHTGIAVGKIAAPALARSQATGSVIQGLGYALYEAREVDSRTGDILTGGMEDYRIPGIADTPDIDVHFDEGGFDHVLGGSVGIGEVATVPTSPALANAIRNATGVRLTEIPIRPDRLIAALKGRAAA